ncbi:oxidoreductase with iron-sulfur subunit [Streptomyces sp. e14]|nr:oxidoreductase with iron-sulfur subunit [Streptomyces sp. e14]
MTVRRCDRQAPRARRRPARGYRGEARLEYDVAQGGYCRPGQIMAAVAKVRQARAGGHEIGDADLDEIRGICRCGTYHRIREAIRAGAARM